MIIHQMPGGELGLLFIKRAEHPLDPWSGHVAFPGGLAQEAQEPGPKVALREVQEEVGLILRESLWQGHLPAVETSLKRQGSSLSVQSEIFVFPDEIELSSLSPCPDEVDQVFAMSLVDILATKNRTTVPWEHNGVQLTFPGIENDVGVIWGLTYRLIQTFLEEFAGLPLRSSDKS